MLELSQSLRLRKDVDSSEGTVWSLLQSMVQSLNEGRFRELLNLFAKFGWATPHDWWVVIPQWQNCERTALQESLVGNCVRSQRLNGAHQTTLLIRVARCFDTILLSSLGLFAVTANYQICLNDGPIFQLNMGSPCSILRFMHFHRLLLNDVALVQVACPFDQSCKQVVVLDTWAHTDLSLFECLLLFLIENELLHQVLLGFD